MNGYFNRKDLVYTVYQEKSISKAAKKLFVSQPSLSIMLRKIEEEIGTPLFDRTSKPLRLTQAGQEYIKATQAMLQIESAFEDYINAANELMVGSLNVGGNQLLSSLVLHRYVSEFIQNYPNIRLNLTDNNSLALENMICDGLLDIVIDNHRLDDKLFVQQLWRTEYLLLAVPVGFACNTGLERYQLTQEDILSGAYLEPGAEPVPLERFRNVPFVSMTRDNDTRRCADEIFREANMEANTILEIDRLVTLYNFIENGTAASIVSDTLVQHMQHHAGKVVFYRLASARARREIYVSYKRNRYYSKAMRVFVELMFRIEEERERPGGADKTN